MDSKWQSGDNNHNKGEVLARLQIRGEIKKRSKPWRSNEGKRKRIWQTDTQLCRSPSNLKGSVNWSQTWKNNKKKLTTGSRRVHTQAERNLSLYIFPFIFISKSTKSCKYNFCMKGTGKKSGNADIILKRKKIQYKSEQLVMHIEIPAAGKQKYRGHNRER